jgi:hypothetical protein
MRESKFGFPKGGGLPAAPPTDTDHLFDFTKFLLNFRKGGGDAGARRGGEGGGGGWGMGKGSVPRARTASPALFVGKHRLVVTPYGTSATYAKAPTASS